MTIIDVTKDYLELFTAKKDIENMLFERKEISEEFSIQDFIKYINFGTHIYWASESFIYPFKMISTKDNDYIFVVTDETTKNIEPLKQSLNELNYNLTTLVRKTREEVATEELITTPHYIIYNELYYKQ